MNILYILSATTEKGGATKSFLSMAEYVANSGHRVYVVVPDKKGVTEKLKQLGWTVLAVPYTFKSLPRISFSPKDILLFLPRWIKSMVLNYKAKKKVIDFAALNSVDIVHENTSVTDLGHYVGQALGIPHVVHLREYGWKDFRLVLPGLHRRLSSTNAWVIAITSRLAEFRGKGLCKERIKVIYNGVINEDEISYNPYKEKWFLYAGRIEPGKGISDLIDSFIDYVKLMKKSGREPFKLKIAGGYWSNSYIKSLYRKVEKTGVEEYVEWLGIRNDVKELYEKTAATIIPSHNEGFGRVMPEAMASGSLCIVRDKGGLAEQLENGIRITGDKIAFSFNTPEELTEILVEISSSIDIEKPFLRGGDFEKIIKNSQSVITALYTAKVSGESVLDFYSHILYN